MPQTPIANPGNGTNARDLAMAEKVQILRMQHNEAKSIFAKFKIAQDPYYYDLFGPNAKRINRFIENHYINGSMMALELTGSLPIALAYLYHGIEDKQRIGQISIVGDFDEGHIAQVRRILDNYREVKLLTNYYTAQEIVENLHNVLANQEQFLLRVVDEWNRLRVAIDCQGTMSIDMKALAEKLSNAYLPIAHILGFHLLDVRARDTVFSVLNPKMYEVVHRAVYGDSSDKASGKPLNAVRRGVEKILAGFLAQCGFSGEVQTRIKSVYGVYKKLTEKHEIGDKYIEGFIHELIPRVHDLVAARIILSGADNSEEAVYRFHREFRNAPFFKYANPEQLMKPTDKAHKDYIKKPYEDRPAYASIHDILSMEAMEAFHKAECGKGLFGQESGLKIKLLEVQARSRDMDEVANYGTGPENHGNRLYLKAMPSLEEAVSRIKMLQDEKRIEREIRISVIETSGGAASAKGGGAGNEGNRDFEKCAFNKNHLEKKIALALLDRFRNAGIGNIPLGSRHMDRIYGSGKSAIDVYAHHNRMTGEVVIERIKVTKR